jgi:DNA-binding NarL/FixJ family response regulator
VSVRVLVADDQPLMRAALRVSLAAEPDVEVVAEAADGREAVELAARHAPDVVVIDLRMPGTDGITATRIIRTGTEPRPRVLVLTTFDLDEYVLAALRAGASGFLLKTTPPATIVSAIKACARGEMTLGPTVVRRLVDSYVHQPTPPARTRLDELTARELDVLLAMAGGLSNAEIGAALAMAETTVKTHVTRVLAKLGVRDRVQAVVLAHRSGLLDGR